MKQRMWLFDNLGLKLFAVVLALLLYLHVLTDRTIEQVIYFPLALESLADTLALSQDPPQEVGVLLRGSGKQLLRLRYLRPSMSVSLAGVTTGTYQRPFVPGDVPLEGTTGVTVLDVRDPSALRLEIGRRAVRTVRVSPALSGSPARGFIAGAPLVRPPEVRLSGPRDSMSAEDRLATEAIPIAGRRDTVEVVQALARVPSWATVTPGSVLVTVPIEPEVVRTFELGVEVRSIRGLLRAEVRPRAVRITWRGARSRASRIQASDLRARVDAKRRGTGTWVLPVEVSGPGANQVQVEPESVTVVLH